MAELHVRHLPPEVHLWLRQRAHLGADARLAEELVRDGRERSG